LKIKLLKLNIFFYVSFDIPEERAFYSASTLQNSVRLLAPNQNYGRKTGFSGKNWPKPARMALKNGLL